MKILKFVLMILTIGCQSRQSVVTSDSEIKKSDSTVSKIEDVQNDTLRFEPTEKDSSFQSFFIRFNNDSLFQLQRTVFPFLTLTWKPEDEDPVGERIEIEEWKMLSLIYYDSFAVREHNAFKQEIRDLGFETQVQLTGIKNSVQINYIFVNENGRYKLVKREKYSSD